MVADLYIISAMCSRRRGFWFTKRVEKFSSAQWTTAEISPYPSGELWSLTYENLCINYEFMFKSSLKGNF